MASTGATAAEAQRGSHGKANPLEILQKEGCKCQSLTVSDQHATLLLSSVIDDRPVTEGGGDDDDEEDTQKTVQSLLKLTIVPFHKSLLGSNAVISARDIERGRFPERNLLHHSPPASAEIVSFLRRYSFELKSESGAEYSYYAARPNSDLCALSRSPNGTPGQDGQSSSVGTAVSNFGGFDVELISPASPYQVSRAMPSLGHVLVRETPELYETVVRPYIKSIVDSGSLSWIQNLIEQKKEKERLLVNRDDFIINIDTKWRSHPPPLTTPRKEWYKHPSTADLYCLGIVKQSGITCLRDLKKDHVPMLKDLEKTGLDVIQEVYGVENDQIRVFIHYQPQFYHFHVHFTRLENEVACSVERGHLLSDVVQNLEDTEYYRKRVITYKLKKGTPLQNLIENHDVNAE